MHVSRLEFSRWKWRISGSITAVRRTFWHVALTEFLRKKRIVEPTGIQRLAREVVRSGQNALLLAETGSGKTYGYVLPTVERLVEEGPRRTLVVVPTWELQQQLRSVVSELDTVISVSEHFDICTPGKLAHREYRLELLRRHQTIVLDEADTLLGGATESLMSYFVNDAVGIERTQQPFQWIFVAATWPRHVSHLVDRRWKNMVSLKSDRLHRPVNTLTEHYEDFDDDLSRHRRLIELVTATDAVSTLIFVNTRESAERLYQQTKDLVSIDRVHNGLGTRARCEKTLEEFRSGAIRNLICTDSMSRGMDFTEVSRVIQYEFARNTIDHLHRIGRTARSGLPGTVHHMILPVDKRFAEQLRAQDPSNLESIFSRRRSFARKLKRIPKEPFIST